MNMPHLSINDLFKNHAEGEAANGIDGLELLRSYLRVIHGALLSFPEIANRQAPIRTSGKSWLL